MFRFEDGKMNLGDYTLVQKFGPDVLNVTCLYPEFIMVKTNEMVDAYRSRLEGKTIGSLLEVGIQKGGSVVLFNEMLKPQRHMGVDIIRHEGGLDTYVERTSSPGREIHIRYDISQSEPDAIVNAWKDRFGEDPVFDIVIDDASHNYDLSLPTFNGLFKYVAPGGVYAIEDWAWAHWDDFQNPDNQEYPNRALSNLIIYCVLAAATGKSGIARVDVTPDTVFVHRDMNSVPDNLDIETAFLTRGREYTHL